MLHTSENVTRTSATAYYFARYLHKALGVPVGLIVSSWGGSTVETWMSEETVTPFGVDVSMLHTDKELPQMIQHQPCVLFNAKVAPLTDFAIRGMIWYQGENNRHNTAQYERMLPAMVADYRARWGGDFSFYYVELAPYPYEDARYTLTAYFREMQLRLMDIIPRSGMVVTADLGSGESIHPPKKEEVGTRLALWALEKDYGRVGAMHRSPVYRSMEVKEGKVFIAFDHAHGKVHPLNRSLESSEIAGADKIFRPAQAMVDLRTQQLMVWSDAVPDPVAVRYAFRNFAEASLYDHFGQPVAPFRTDNW
jgi:sialate O-acetylesterase